MAFGPPAPWLFRGVSRAPARQHTKPPLRPSQRGRGTIHERISSSHAPGLGPPLVWGLWANGILEPRLFNDAGLYAPSRYRWASIRRKVGRRIIVIDTAPFAFPAHPPYPTPAETLWGPVMVEMSTNPSADLISRPYLDGYPQESISNLYRHRLYPHSWTGR